MDNNSKPELIPNDVLTALEWALSCLDFDSEEEPEATENKKAASKILSNALQDKNRVDYKPNASDGWHWLSNPNDIPPVGEWLCKLRWSSGKVIHQVLDRVDADDHSWELDKSELSYSLDVIAYRPIPDTV